MRISLFKTRPILVTIAIIIGYGAAFHFVGLFKEVNDASFSKHLTFVIIDSICVYGLIKRPKNFIYFFTLLTIQQIYSHGSQLMTAWTEQKIVDWVSIIVLIIFPLGSYLLWLEKRNL